ncbi:MAG: hypothetical protein LBC02_06415 [Planctomycetaceae bacterium]|nr:hypothetical protein [Planctomycetaceae bacterium]
MTNTHYILNGNNRSFAGTWASRPQYRNTQTWQAGMKRSDRMKSSSIDDLHSTIFDPARGRLFIATDLRFCKRPR